MRHDDESFWSYISKSFLFRLVAAVLSGHPLSVLALMLINGLVCFWISVPNVNWVHVGIVTLVSGLAYRWLNNIFIVRLWGYFFKFGAINMVARRRNLSKEAKHRLIEDAAYEHRRCRDVMEAREALHEKIRKLAVEDHYDRLIRLPREDWMGEINERLKTANEKYKQRRQSGESS